MDLDWTRFHPDARTTLDDPFFWTRDNDLAPNGNDTGHDLFEEFRRWNRRRPNGPPLAFLHELMRGWQIATIDWTTTDEDIVRTFLLSDPVAFAICNQAAVGLFA